MKATLSGLRAGRRREKQLSFNPDRPAWKEPAPPIYNAIKAVVIGGISLSIVIPLLLVVSTSLADDEQLIAAGGFVLWPTRRSFAAYEAIFSSEFMIRALGVSAFITAVGTFMALFITITMAYATSRPVLFGRPVLLLVLFTLLFAPGLIPMFLMEKQLGLLNTIKTVAAEAGVSTVTVSYVLAGRTRGNGSGISAATAERVHTAANKLGYRPNQAAQTIRTGKSNLMILSLTILSDPWSLSVSKAVGAAVASAGITLMILADTDWRTAIKRQGADIIFIDAAGNDGDAELLAELGRTSNLVVFSETLEPNGFDVIRSVAGSSMDAAMDHLTKTHTKVACLTSRNSLQVPIRSGMEPIWRDSGGQASPFGRTMWPRSTVMRSAPMRLQ